MKLIANTDIPDNTKPWKPALASDASGHIWAQTLGPHGVWRCLTKKQSPIMNARIEREARIQPLPPGTRITLEQE